MFRVKFFIIFFLAVNQFAWAQDSLAVFKKRKIGLGVFCVSLTSGSLIYLNQAWYQAYSTSHFHTFNDNEEWLQMDKVGHVVTNFQIGRLMMDAMDWAGYAKKKQILIGGLSGLAYMSAVEVMDGYSDGWGFSWGDMGANALGSGIAIGQKALWNEQRIQLKYSYNTSPYAKYRPDLLGESTATQVLKDYNGQIYWLSINPSSFMNKETRFPKWLNVAFGYGANGMLGAFYNNVVVQDESGNVTSFNRYRQGYFSLDVDLTRIKTKSKILKSVFYGLNIIKLPFPNLELSQGKLKFNYY